MTTFDLNAIPEAPGRPLYDLGSEQAVLGAMMLSPVVIAEVEPLLTPGSFYRPAHGIIYRTVCKLHEAGQPTDPVVVVTKLTDTGDITRVGGMNYVHDLVAAVPTAANGTHYARTVADLATLRELDSRTRQIQQLIAQPGGATTAELVDRAQQMLADLEPTTRDDDGPIRWRDLAPTVLEEMEQAATTPDQPAGIPTGLTDLDNLLGGLRPGQLVVVAGRPGMGKSVLLANTAQHATWKKTLPAVVFSLEMTRVELGMRFLSSDTSIPLDSVQAGKLDDTEWSSVARSAGESSDAPLWIDDTPGLTLADIRARARRLARAHGGLSLIAIDYLQMISHPRSENRELAVASISRGLKLLAKELGVPVVVAAQVNRGPEARPDKRPQLADLRESGAIEADADVVILIHREDYYDKESPRAGEADLIVAKHRNGQTDTITVAAQLHLARFWSIAMPEESSVR